MKTFTITKSHLDENNFYVGSENLETFEGHITSDDDLGVIRFHKGISCTGSIVFGTRTGIAAGEGIKAGSDIKAGYGIEAGEGIKAGWRIVAGLGIKAGWRIVAGYGIEAGWGIKAGSGIEAGLGIKAGLTVFAGINTWEKCAIDKYEIRCTSFTGDVGYGKLVIVPEKESKPESSCVGKLIEIDGKKYKLVEA